MLLTSTNEQAYNELFGIVLGAFHAGLNVNFLFDVVDGQCKVSRVIMSK